MKKVEFKFDERSLESVEKLRRQGIEVPSLPEKAEETVTPKNEVAEIKGELLHELIGAAGEVALITSTQDSRIVRLGMAWRKWRNAGGKINSEPEPSSPRLGSHCEHCTCECVDCKNCGKP